MRIGRTGETNTEITSHDRTTVSNGTKNARGAEGISVKMSPQKRSDSVTDVAIEVDGAVGVSRIGLVHHSLLRAHRQQ
jgi:hypothetical protein